MRTSLLILALLSILPLSGCAYKYSWGRGWHYNERWASEIIDGMVDKDDGFLEEQREDFEREDRPPRI